MTKLLSELYQILSTLNAGDEVLDQVSAAICGKPLPKDTLLPYLPPNKEEKKLNLAEGEHECFIESCQGRFLEVAMWASLVIGNVSSIVVIAYYVLKTNY